MNPPGFAGSSAAADSPSDAQSVYAQFLRLRERDPEASFESFCEERPKLVPALEHLHRTWGEVGDALDHLVEESSSRTPQRQSEGAETKEEGVASTLEGLANPRRAIDRYRVLDEIARGGMGRVLRVWDEDLRRQVAMKVVLEPSRRKDASEVGAEERTRRLARFLEEAQITGQLDHPGIVPVHELGLDDEGRVFFTLKLVRGCELRQVFDWVRRGEEDWNQTRVLGTLLRICEAMAFAHEHGVVHRDLKPSNIMVGPHGETYVMDWGLARLTKEATTRNTLGDSDATNWDGIVSRRHESGSDTPGSPVVTADGDVLGTPQYMSPEQARGELDTIGPPADVYAVGAMLYELLAGQPPYPKKGPAGSPYAVVQRVIHHAPPALAKVASKQPCELIAICEKAMARRIGDRYPDMSEMAEDLRAFLEGRVVRAWRTGAMVELKKWIGRNRFVAALMGILVVGAVGAGFLSAWQERARQSERLDRLATAHVESGTRSWPIHPDFTADMERWLDGARQLQLQLPRQSAALEQLRQAGTPVEGEGRGTDPKRRLLQVQRDNYEYLVENFPVLIERARDTLASQDASQEDKAEATHMFTTCEMEQEEARQGLEAILAKLERSTPWIFQDPELQARHDRQARFVANLEVLTDPERGLILEVEQRLQKARRLHETSVVAEAESWKKAIASIADPGDCPLYEGLEITPQLGVVPLRRNAEPGLWEFWHTLSGERPEWDGDSWVLTPETGLVLVLVPGGKFWMGAQGVDESRELYDPVPYPYPVSIHSAEIDAFFLSKYEMTQAQWARLTGEWPSLYAAGQRGGGVRQFTRMHPVESVTKEGSLAHLFDWSLTLPTEAQWERAVRVGQPYLYGAYATIHDVPHDVNCADETYHLYQKALVYISGRDDGWLVHAPVDAVSENPWGLVGMLGNVQEWVLDGSDIVGSGYGDFRDRPPSLLPGTGEHRVDFRSMNIYRGGCFTSEAKFLRPANRNLVGLNSMRPMIGVRPARWLESRGNAQD